MNSQSRSRTFMRVALTITLGALLLAPTSAFAQTKVQGGPLTNIDPAGGTIHMALSGFPTTGGLYILQCLNTVKAGATKEFCNSANQLWVSNDANAPTKPNGDVALKVVGNVAGTECGTDKCSIFVTFDHTAAADRSEDQLIPISFKAGTSVPSTPNDLITATVGTKVLSTRIPGSLAYRAPVKIVATAKSGSAVTFASSTPDCTVVKGVITALKGTGACDITASVPASTGYSATTAHYPFMLTLGVQTVPPSRSLVAVGGTLILGKVTNFGETVTYKSISKTCSVSGFVVTGLKTGTCYVMATAPGQATLWGPTNKKKVIKVS